MADMNDFLHKLGLKNTIPQYENSPMDPMKNQDSSETLDPEDFMPAEEVAPSRSQDLGISQADIDLMKTYPRSPAEEAAPAKKPEVVPTELPQSEESKRLSRYQELMNAYKDRNKNFGYAQVGNQVAQALAAGQGAKIGSGAEMLSAIRQGELTPDQQLKQEDEAHLVDPNSDISRLYREQAYTLLKKLNPQSDYTGKLEGMSAAQLQKLPGMKSIGATSTASPWIATDRVDAQGNPVRFNKMTGEFSTADGNVIKSGDYTARDILRRDPLTGQYAIGSAGAGMKVLPTHYGKGVDLSKGEKGQEVEKPREVTYGEFAKNAPEQAKQFNKIRDDFNKDMRDSREVATSITNLSSKLKAGGNKVDSGLLGGIQTQAAKMAGQKGVLTDQDLVKFAGAGGVEAKIGRIIDGSLFGEMSDEDVKFFKRFSQLMGKSLNEDIQNRSQLYVEQGRQLVDTTVPGVTPENISKMLGVDKVAPVVQDKAKKFKPTPGSIVNIKGKQYRVEADGDTLTPINK